MGLVSGAAYIFRNHDDDTPGDPDDDFWYQEVKLLSSDLRSLDQFGYSVAVKDDRVAVGAFGDDTVVATSSGSGYVFRYVGRQWVQEQKLLASDGEWADHLGRSVALGEGQVFGGAPWNNEAAHGAGAAYVYPLVDDCNANCVPDEEDIATGFSGDCDGNGVPDECEDCNGNGLADACDIDAGAPDCNANGLPDECDRDCNGDGLPDECAVVCSDHCECNDFSACTLDYCVDSACVRTQCLYGDVTGNGVVNVFDVFGILDQIAGTDGQSTMHLYDIVPCDGDDTVNVFDALAVLDAVAGIDPCCSGP